MYVAFVALPLSMLNYSRCWPPSTDLNGNLRRQSSARRACIIEYIKGETRWEGGGVRIDLQA